MSSWSLNKISPLSSGFIPLFRAGHPLKEQHNSDQKQEFKSQIAKTRIQAYTLSASASWAVYVISLSLCFLIYEMEPC